MAARRPLVTVAGRIKELPVGDTVVGIPLATTAPVDVTKAAAAVGVSTEAARADHKHDVTTTAPAATGVATASAEGVATTLARSDHAHQSNTAPVNVTKAAAAIGTSGEPARADHKHDASTAAPAATGVATASAEGVATTLARSDHAHQSNTAPVNVTKAAAAIGTSGEPARADHKHDASTAAPAATGVATASAEGVATTLARSDHAHQSNTAPVNVTKAAAAIGTSGEPARADHKHDASTAAPAATGVATASAEGVATTLARSDHAHQSNTAPVNVTKAAAAIGTSGEPARADHKHDVTTAAAVAVGTANAEGVATTLARSDHTHQVTGLVIAGQVQGDIIYFDGAAWVRLAPGTAGQKLQTNGAAANPSWATVAAFLQRFTFQADQFENPVTANWAVNALAPVSADTVNSGLHVRRFDDTAEEGVGCQFTIPPGSVNVVFYFKWRAQTAPGGVVGVQPTIYHRNIPDNAAVGAWSAALNMTALSVPTNANPQHDSQTISLATLGWAVNEHRQLELTRRGTQAGDTLAGDWDLFELILEFTT